MKFEINNALNGWVLKCEDSDSETMVVGAEAEDEVECFSEFLTAIDEHYGPTTSKYSPKRIRIICVPGNSFEGEMESGQLESLRYLYEDLKSLFEEKSHDG